MVEYAPQWAHYRRLVVYWVAIFASYVPVVLCIGVFLKRVFHTEALVPYVAIFWACLWVIFFLRICTFRCPRCGEYFIGEWWYGNFSMRRRCFHCGLPRPPEILSVVSHARK